MLTPAQIAEFKTQGYLRSAKVLDDAQVEILRAEVERVIDQRERTDIPQPVLCHNFTHNETAPVWQIVNIWEASAPFKRLTTNALICEEMAQLTGADSLRIWHDQIQYKPAARGGINMWHQDAPLWPIIAPMTEVTAWVALDDVDDDNGCMSMVPGSHLWGDHMNYLRTWKDFTKDVPAEFEGHPVTVRKCPVKKGEVHYHHSLTWHGSHANTSGRPRRAIALHFMTGETRYVATGEHCMKQFVTVEDGALLQGEHFPLVWSRR
ncbi:MAG: phytanoyl-CoA dioxygenase family protein [Cephaloticoccus sp.]|nr:phytanoyl-CoA dioxygenase family protein [Cephaloticoccus sp.]